VDRLVASTIRTCSSALSDSDGCSPIMESRSTSGGFAPLWATMPDFFLTVDEAFGWCERAQLRSCSRDLERRRNEDRVRTRHRNEAMVSGAIAGIGSAFPPPMDQQQAWDEFFGEHYSNSRIARRVWSTAGIETRHSAVDPRREDLSNSTPDCKVTKVPASSHLWPLPRRRSDPDAGRMADHGVLTVGIDGSEHSTCALAWAAREAQRRGCRLRVVHAYTVPVYGTDFGVGATYPSADLPALQSANETTTRAQLTDVVAAYPDLEIETVVRSGWAVGAIVDDTPEAELTVIGSHGAGAFAAVFLGSVAHGVVHRSKGAVVLVPNTLVPATIANIGVATDGSPASQTAVNWAADEADQWGAELTLIHAWEYPYVGPRTGTVEPAELMELDAARLMKTAIADLHFSRPNLKAAVHAKVVQGPAISAIVDASEGTDLLVVGARGHGALRSLILGSTSSAIIHRATCPVAVIHPPAD
jgi:nucleotide-binding universal stress UspA family protein